MRQTVSAPHRDTPTHTQVYENTQADTQAELGSLGSVICLNKITNKAKRRRSKIMQILGHIYNSPATSVHTCIYTYLLYYIPCASLGDALEPLLNSSHCIPLGKYILINKMIEKANKNH